MPCSESSKSYEKVDTIKKKIGRNRKKRKNKNSMAEKWIKGAIKHPGALKAQAKAARMSLDEFCSQKNLSTKTKQRCSLRKTLIGFKKK